MKHAAYAGQAAELLLDRGVNLSEQGDARGLLWLARGVQSVGKDNPDLDRALRLNLAAWSKEAHPLRFVLPGKSYVGMRTDDVGRWTRVLKTMADEVHLLAIGEAAIPALHAAALDRAAYKSTTFREMIPSWESLVSATEAIDQSVNTVHGALRHYDLPDLRKMIGVEGEAAEGK